MRDIKFRAWSKKDKLMLPWSTIRQSGFNNLKDGFGLLYQILVTRREDFDLMQYTGLKDKEGKEIYDGDVVKYEVYNLNEKSHFYNGEIQWWQGQLGTGWRYKSKNTTFMLKTFNVFKMEKIGNKYDNPELLKQ